MIILTFLSVQVRSEKEPIQVPSANIIRVQTDGLVCSFCAYGAEKSLSKLGFVDESQFGGDGIKVDVKKGFSDIAIQTKKDVDINKIISSIKKGGYVAKRVSMVIEGKTQKLKSQTVMKNTGYPYTFVLTNKDGSGWVPKDKLEKQRLGIYFLLDPKFKIEKETLKVVVTP